MSTVQNVLEAIRVMPGLITTDVYKLMPDKSAGAVSGALNALQLKGEIIYKDIPNPEPKKVGTKPTARSWYINPDPKKTPQPIAKRYNTKKKSQKTITKPTPVAVEFNLAQAKERIAELEAWKVEAIKRYPDLAVPPIVIQARKLVASQLNGADANLAREILAGHKDTILPVRVAIAALESMA